MTLSESDLNRVIQLAHLDIDAALKQKYLDQLGHVLTHMDVLNKAHLDGVTPMTDVLGIPTPLRDDTPVVFDPKAVLDQAPMVENGYFVVPKILGDAPSA